MKRWLRSSILIGLGVVLAALAGGGWYVRSKMPQRDGELALSGLTAAVTVRYDERGVPHIRAENEADLYRALGYVHAQDRLFQMEVLRRLARGELAEVLGPKLLETDQLFRTLSIRSKADQMAAAMDWDSASGKALLAYLDGVNAFMQERPAPMEFDILGIPKRRFTPADTFSVAGYMAYTLSGAFRHEPALTHVRDRLGPQYLSVFDLAWHPEGVVQPDRAMAQAFPILPGGGVDGLSLLALSQVASVSQRALEFSGVPLFEGSNAWALAGSRTASGKPLLAGDPHMAFATPAVWYEAHVSAPGFELYGHFLALLPNALLGHNRQFGWSLTMFQNDDVDLVAERVNPADDRQVWHRGQWVDLKTREEIIRVKDAPDERLTVKISPHGPIVTSAFGGKLGTQPLAMWWALLDTENPLLQASYEFNRADTLEKMRAAASKLHAPGLNVIWANAAGDIGWWAAAKLPKRPPGTNPNFILDGAKGEGEKLGFHPFSDNPQEENPARGYVLSANHQPFVAGGIEVPGYYAPPARVRRLDELLRPADRKWDLKNSQALQLDSSNGYARSLLAPLQADLRAAARETDAAPLVEQLLAWDGDYLVERIAPTLFVQFQYELARAAMEDEMDDVTRLQFSNLLSNRALDVALPRLAANSDSPWWDDRRTPQKETRKDIVARAWAATLKHLRSTMGKDSSDWTWGKANQLTHVHALGRQPPLDKLFNVGPFQVPGARETPNNFSSSIGPVPKKVATGPSTRRLIDFAQPERALGINPVGQSGVLFDRHYSDQASAHTKGQYMPQHLAEKDVAANTRSTLMLRPSR